MRAHHLAILAIFTPSLALLACNEGATDPPSPATEESATAIESGAPEVGSGDAGATKEYRFDVTAGKVYNVIVETVSGDLDLYTKDQSPLSPEDYQCASVNTPGETENCPTDQTDRSEYFALLTFNEATDFVILVVESDPGCHGGFVNGDPTYCTVECPCGLNEGDCGEDDSKCATGLFCAGVEAGDLAFGEDVKTCIY